MGSWSLLFVLFAATIVKATQTYPECACEIDALPEYSDKANTARWMARSLDWGVLTTISSRLNPNSAGPIPFGNVYSFVDGPCNNSTGTPYIYGTYMDQSFVDSVNNTNVALTLSAVTLNSACLSESSTQDVIKQDACIIGSEGMGDPELPLCARLVLTGQLAEVTDPVEKDWAQKALFSRHKSMPGWPGDHSWIVAKIDLTDIWLIDYFGGATVLDMKDYYGATELKREPVE